MLIFVVGASWWLELAFKLRVLRNPKRLFLTIGLVSPWFVIWDIYATTQGHWFFDRSLTLGIYGPFGLPLEEYLFFVFIPIAAVLTLEGVESTLRILKKLASRKKVTP
jgi:lycopene cyclase domain-containing protein